MGIFGWLQKRTVKRHLEYACQSITTLWQDYNRRVPVSSAMLPAHLDNFMHIASKFLRELDSDLAEDSELFGIVVSKGIIDAGTHSRDEILSAMRFLNGDEAGNR